ncbi:MAG: aldo/keto reductase [Nostoc sp. EfeVER01]|uniref:aldo/keto reductase n=1 Tax=unclassified Nostoc TaxID=2593658 RepID=UPI002AD51EF8|nr:MULTISPECIES: aldo/keto reductase [unclassified Nostoc]MDZ7946364.1 aldo/keto reductase [Nostoc sp. EfeVER01]MDZ7993883.1 aldo/keto reductase [Nostoc sp. EspVER01]
MQIEYSLISRSAESEIFPVLEELGIGVTAYGVLSRGLLSGSTPATQSLTTSLYLFFSQNRVNFTFNLF